MITSNKTFRDLVEVKAFFKNDDRNETNNIGETLTFSLLLLISYF